jgi:predicted aspartyl protease
MLLTVASALPADEPITSPDVPAVASLDTANPVAAPLGDDHESLQAIPSRGARIGRIIAPVMINGHGPFHFMLDTGATRTVLSARVLRMLGITQNAEVQTTVLGVSGSTTAPTAHIDSLEAGALQFHDLQLPILAGPLLDGIDGILGADCLENEKITANFRGDRVSIGDSTGQAGAPNYAVIHMQFLPTHHLLMAQGYVGPVWTKLIIDTGGMHTLGNPALLAALRRAHYPTEGMPSSVEDATQALQPALVTRVPRLRIGTAAITNLDVTFGDFRVFQAWGLKNEPALLIGMDVLGTVSELNIDYRRKELQWLPGLPWRSRLPVPLMESGQ